MRSHAIYGPTEATVWIYFLQAGDYGPIKVGHSGNPTTRLAMVDPCPGFEQEPIRILTAYPSSRWEESRLHHLFSESRISGEWFRPDGAVTDYVRAVIAGAACATTPTDWTIGGERVGPPPKFNPRGSSRIPPNPCETCGGQGGTDLRGCVTMAWDRPCPTCNGTQRSAS